MLESENILISFRHTSIDSTDSKDSSTSGPSTENEATPPDALDLNSNISESTEDESTIQDTTYKSNHDTPKIKSKNNQASTKHALKRLYSDCTLPTLRPRRKRSSVENCTCMWNFK